MSHNNALFLTSTIVDEAELVVTPVTVAGKGTSAGVNVFLLSVRDRVNGEPSFCYLTPEQMVEAGEWFIKMGKERRLTRKEI